MSGGEGKNVGFGFAKKKKSVVVGVNARGEDDDDGEDGDASQREYLTGVSGSGLELKDKKFASAPKSIAVQDNTFEVGTGRRRKAPSFLPTEEEIVKDDERFETAERIGGKGEIAQAGEVQYGLTKMGPKDGDAHPGDGAAARGVQDSFIGKSLAEKELQAFKEDVEDLPEQSTMEDYESMPIEDFGAAMLRGMGWEEGKPIGRNASGLVSAVEFVPRGGRLGLGATGAPPPTNNKKHIKPGESRDAPAQMVLAQGPEGKSRNVRSLDEKLVKKEAPGAREGKNMKVVEGRHRGLTGRVLRIVKEEGRSDRALIELKSSGETITVRCSELADIDAANASGENRGARGAGAGEKRKREKREDPAWLQGNTRVRIVSKSFEGGRLYLKKGVVVDVLTPRECVVEINDSGEVLSGVPQRVLETALPKRGGRVAVVLGPKKGQRGKLLDKKGEAASVQLSEDFTVQNFTLDQIAECAVIRCAGRQSTPWKISERDYPEGEVILGMELRMHSLKAAPVDTANAEFQRPGVTTALDDVSEESVREAVTKVLNHFNWKGPVGVSVTRAIMRALGNEATAKNLESMMPKSKGKVATMIHTEAAAYTELMFGPGRETNGLVVVMTIGKGMGTVTYNRGQKVRNSDLKHLTWTYERELGKLHDKFDWMGVAPRLDDETAEQVVELVTASPPEKALFSSGRGGANPFYECELQKLQGLESVMAWATLIDKYIQKIARSVKPDQIILLTTGAASDLPEELLLPLLRPGVAAAGLDPGVLVIGDFPDRALVKGAAVGAHIELGRRQAAEIFRAALTETITGRPEPREVFEQDLLWAFKRMDRDGNGLLSHDDLFQGAKLMGTSFSDTEITGLLRDFTGGLESEATPTHFLAWFNRMVDLASSKVHVIRSEDEFLQNLKAAREQPSTVTGQVLDDGSLVVLECGYTHCRPCMMFEKQYEGVASKYLDTVFLKVMGDECPGSAHLCRDVLEVSGTPEFRFYRGGNLLHIMNGADKAKLEANVQHLLQAGEFGARSHLPVNPTAGEAPPSPKKEWSGAPR